MNNRTSLMAAFVAGITGAVTAANPNLTTNPGFLDANSDATTGDGWGVWGAALEWLNFFGDGNPGHATLFGDVAGNTGGVFQTGISGSPGTTYEVTIHVQWESNWDADTHFGLEFYAADDATLISSSVIEITEDQDFTGFGYRRYDHSAVAPAGTVFVRPVVFFDNNNAGGASRACTVDNILLSEADDILNINPGFGDLVADAVNGDFWDKWGATAFDLDFFNNGNPGHATFFADQAGNFGGVYQPGVPATPGESYTFSVDLSFEASYDARTTIELEFYGADDGFLIGEVSQEITEIPGAGYVTYQIDAVAPAAFTTFVRPVVSFADTVSVGPQTSATADNAVVQLTSTVSNGCNAADLAEPFGVLDLSDISAFVAGFTTSDPVADINEDGLFDLNDISGFIAGFTAGCP